MPNPSRPNEAGGFNPSRDSGRLLEPLNALPG